MNSTQDTAVIDALSINEKIGFRLRLAIQRHTAKFLAHMDFGLTQTQFAVLARLRETRAASQNELGRSAAVDSATIRGVVQRLQATGLVAAKPPPSDRCRRILEPTARGKKNVEAAITKAKISNKETLTPLKAVGRKTLIHLLGSLSD